MIQERMIIRLMLVAVILFSALKADAAIAIRGTVVNDSGKAVINAVVSLVKNALVDTTDINGMFELLSSGAPVRWGIKSIVARHSVSIDKNKILFTPVNDEPAGISVYRLDGTKIASAQRTNNSVNPLVINTNGLAGGRYIISMSAGTMTESFVYTYAHESAPIVHAFGSQVTRGAVEVYGTALSDSIVDTLVIVSGLQRTVYPLTNLVDTTIALKVSQSAMVYRQIVAVADGGSWYDSKTWIGGVIPDKNCDVIINGTVSVTSNGTDSASCHSITISKGAALRAAAYQAQTIFVYGDLTNKGDVRDGPGYASYDDATLRVKLYGGLYQDSLYRPVLTWFAGSQSQSIAVGTNDYLSGTFKDIVPSSPISALSDIDFKNCSITFESSSVSGRLEMNDKLFRVSAGSFTLANGVLVTSILSCDSLTTITCPRVTSLNGNTLLKGQVRTATIQFDTSVTVDSGAVLFNQANIDAIMTVNGDFTNKGITRRGPGYAAYGEGNLAMAIKGDFRQAGTYTVQHTKFTGGKSHNLTVNQGSILQGLYYANESVETLNAATAIYFTEFTLDFGAQAGKLSMGTYSAQLKGACAIKGGTFEVAILKGDSLSTLTCKTIKGTSGLLTLKGQICTDSSTIDADVVVDTNAVFYNKANTDAVVTIKGNFTNNGITRRGPGYAAYGEGNLALLLEKNFRQNGIYTVQLTRFTGTSEQTIGSDSAKIIQGIFYDITPSSALRAVSKLWINEARFILSTDTNKGILKMDTFRLIHQSGNLQIDSGSLQVDSITGGVDGNTIFTIKTISTKNGSISISKHYRTSSCAITGKLVVETDGIFYNHGNVDAVITANTTDIKGKIGSGPGYAAYGEGTLTLNGALLPVWR
jgi:hypothetical protein